MLCAGWEFVGQDCGDGAGGTVFEEVPEPIVGGMESLGVLRPEVVEE